jgi:hypothetical protein
MSSMIPISHDVLRDRLRNGAVKFYFRKVKGDLRAAFGTLDLSRVPASGQPKGGQRPPGVTSYFDLEKNVWRSVSHSQEIWLDQ